MAGCGLFPHLGSPESAKLKNKNLPFKSALLVPTVSTSAFHSTKLFLFSQQQPKIPPIALSKGQRSKRQSFDSLRWPIYVINSVNYTKLPRYTRCWCRLCLKPPVAYWIKMGTTVPPQLQTNIYLASYLSLKTCLHWSLVKGSYVMTVLLGCPAGRKIYFDPEASKNSSSKKHYCSAVHGVPCFYFYRGKVTNVGIQL